ncbi:MAG: hypothetical protein AAFY98_11980, partial [Verrucomicrobiota bacterium]
ATKELAKRLGEKEFTALYHEGTKINILMTSLHYDCLLITVFGDATNIGLVRFYSQQATERLNGALEKASESASQAEPLQIDTDAAGGGAPIIG